MNLKRLFLALLLLALVAGSSLLLLREQPLTGKARQVPPAERPVHQMEGLSLTAIRSDGSRHYQLRGETLTEYADQHAEITAPRLTLYAADSRAPWHIRAPRAELTPERNLLLLHDEVRMLREPATEEAPLQIDTRDLHVYPQRDMARTDAEAVIHNPGWESRSQGLQVFFDSAELRQEQRVKDRHEAP